MNPIEEKVWKERYSFCKKCEERKDLVFVYPSEFTKSPIDVADKLQKVMDFLKDITNLDPTVYFMQRTVIGYRHPSDERGKDCQPGWGPNWVNIPWGYLVKKEEPEDACSHELVHPFFRCSTLHKINEGWGEGFCDFMRGPVKRIMGQDGKNWWKDMIQAVKDKKDSKYHYPAGQFVIKLNEKNATSDELTCDLVDDLKAIRDFVCFLFCTFENTSLITYMTPSRAMIKKWGAKGKI